LGTVVIGIELLRITLATGPKVEATIGVSEFVPLRSVEDELDSVSEVKGDEAIEEFEEEHAEELENESDCLGTFCN